MLRIYLSAMSRTGPAYVENEPELLADIKRKRKSGEIGGDVADTFLDLYEFAMELGDGVTIGGAKNANFQMKVDAHQGEYEGNASVITATITKDLNIWGSVMILEDGKTPDTVDWDTEDYRKFETSFQSLRGVPPGEVNIEFEVLALNQNLEQFKEIVEVFVTTCREKAGET